MGHPEPSAKPGAPLAAPLAPSAPHWSLSQWHAKPAVHAAHRPAAPHHRPDPHAAAPGEVADSVPGGIVRAARGFVAKDALMLTGGVAAGMLAANQLAPRIASKLGSKGGTGTPLGQAALKAGVGIALGAIAATFSKSLAAGIAAGGIAEPIVGAIRSASTRNEAAKKGVSGLAALQGIANADADLEYA